ncbi:MAG: HAD-IIB family hydrolase [Candidatus Delongbacteria bacterium]|nr:HAD-IIB family hydrolase [bacterium]MBL7032817.1 HAD-IIB family hydrolase [Candidatus Delongbacteria bacterium]
MLPLVEFPPDQRAAVRCLFADIDDTLTTDGLIPAVAFSSLWQARTAGLDVVLVTGRPAGWVDHIARQWPVRAVIGENGGFWFQMEHSDSGRVMKKHFLYNEAERREFRQRLELIRRELLAEVPGCAIATDQNYREYDLAIDFCEDVEQLPRDQVLRIREIFQRHGAHAKISSIHVNGWYGDFDKVTTTDLFITEELGLKLAEDNNSFAFVGDSPNDEPLFQSINNSIGVANIMELTDLMDFLPRYITSQKGGEGFAELVTALIEARPVDGS